MTCMTKRCICRPIETGSTVRFWPIAAVHLVVYSMAGNDPKQPFALTEMSFWKLSLPLIEQRWFVWTTTAGLVLFIVMGLYFKNDPRMDDGAIGCSEMTVLECATIPISLIAVASMWVAAIEHARSNKDRAWLWINFIVWPCSFIYAWRHYLKGRRIMMIRDSRGPPE